MQAAFVDVGLDKAAFLYVTDVFYDPEFSRQQFELTEGEHDEQPKFPTSTPTITPPIRRLVAAAAEEALALAQRSDSARVRDA